MYFSALQSPTSVPMLQLNVPIGMAWEGQEPTKQTPWPREGVHTKSSVWFCNLVSTQPWFFSTAVHSSEKMGIYSCNIAYNICNGWLATHWLILNTAISCLKVMFPIQTSHQDFLICFILQAQEFDYATLMFCPRHTNLLRVSPYVTCASKKCKPIVHLYNGTNEVVVVCLNLFYITVNIPNSYFNY